MKLVISIIIAFTVFSNFAESAADPVQKSEQCKLETFIRWGDQVFEDNDKFKEGIIKRIMANRVLIAEHKKIKRSKQLIDRVEDGLFRLRKTTNYMKSEALKTGSPAIDLSEKTLQLLEEMSKLDINASGIEQKIEEYKLMAAKNIKQAESSKENVLKYHAKTEKQNARLQEIMEEIDALDADFESSTKANELRDRVWEVRKMGAKWKAIDDCQKGRGNHCQNAKYQNTLGCTLLSSMVN